MDLIATKLSDNLQKYTFPKVPEAAIGENLISGLF